MQTFTPLQYLKIDIASNFGLDKENWDTRLSWFDDNQAELAAIAASPDTAAAHPLMKQADTPAMFFAGIRAWDKASRGEAISYPVGLDATASGAQFLSILIGCDKSASLCNVIDTGRREDLYTNIFEYVSERLADATSVSRDDAKQAIMTSLYGSKAMPRRIFGEGEKLETFYKVMEEEAPGIWALNEALLGLWQPNALSHDWVLPDNFHVQTKVMADRYVTVEFLDGTYEIHSYENRPQAEGLSLGANSVHSIDGMVVREVLRRCSYKREDALALMNLLARPVLTQIIGETSPNEALVKTLWSHYQETGFLSARILWLLDEQNIHFVDRSAVSDLFATIPDAPFDVMTVHDRFSVHPNYANDLRRQYNRVLHDLAKSDVLSSIASQICGEKINVNKYGDFSDKILDANYALS